MTPTKKKKKKKKKWSKNQYGYWEVEKGSSLFVNLDLLFSGIISDKK